LSQNEPDWACLIRDCFNHPNDEAILTRFFHESLPYIRAALLAVYSRDVSVVEDALQDACLKYLAIFKKKPEGDFSIGYFIVVARHCLIDELRRRKGHLPLDDMTEAELPATNSSLDSYFRMLMVQHALFKMDPRCQFVLQSYYINETDPKILASWLAIGQDSIHMVIKRCRDRLRTIISEAEASFRASRN